MGYKKYNDNELIFMYREQYNEKALLELIKKYSVFIKKLLNDYHIKDFYYEDFYSECLMCLLEAIKKYDQNSDKTFTRYVEIFFRRKIIRMMDKLYRIAPDDYSDAELLPVEEEDLYQKISAENQARKTVSYLKDVALNELEYKLFYEVFVLKKVVKQFALENNIPELKAYYIKKKVENLIKKANEND